MSQEPADGTPESPAEDQQAHAPEALHSLRQAMRRARFDDAERVGVIADLRAARLGRLELLEDALAPLIAQIPPDVDLFDIGLMPGANPRLFIDMIGFVEMGRDARLYRFLQDTRHGRVLIAQGEAIDTMVDAITDYIARRLLERDKALAAEPNGLAAPRPQAAPGKPFGQKVQPRNASAGVGATSSPDLTRPTGRPRPTRIAGIAFAFLIDLLGSITFFTILAAIGWVIWNRMHGQS